MGGWDGRLRARLKELGLSVPDLARRMDRSEDQAFTDRLYKIVQGKVKNPRGELLAEIAKAIEWSEARLRYGSDNGRRRSRPLEPTESDDPDSANFPTDGIPEIDVRLGMGGGGFAEQEVRFDGDHSDPVKPESWHFPSTFVREELRAPAARLIIYETQGDSMLPTIVSGERVIVDTGHKVPSPDGIYALRDRYGAIVVKRLQSLRRGDPPRIVVISDNPHHAPEEVGADEIEIVGRVICGLKRY